jgi:glycosyltransferase involved in cell wall biosynthesis
MIKNILIHVGSHIDYRLIVDFCSGNAVALTENNVVCPRFLNGLISKDAWVMPFWNALNEDEFFSLREHLRKIHWEADLSPAPQTLFFSWSSFCLPAGEKLSTLQAGCRLVLPQAGPKIFFCLGRQDLELDYGTRHAFTSIPMWGEHLDDVLRNRRKTLILDYAQSLRLLHSAFGQEAVECVIPDPSRDRQQQVLARLGTALGLAPKFAKELAAGFVSRFSHLLPREAACFAAVSNFHRTGPAIPGTIVRWSPQVRKFTPESGYQGSPHSLIGPELRAEILAEYAASNAEAAAMLGLERLFPDPEPEPDWEPWTGLTSETAYRVAERLDADFVRELLKPFAKLPFQYQTREQRLVHQALLEVSAPAGAVVLPLRKREEPKLSVLTLAYNHAKFIAQNIESVLAQQVDFPMQHIIADDGSDDGTQDIILEYAAKHPNIVPVLRKDRHKTPWNNVQALFDMCRTQYAALCDGDDYFSDPAKLQSQVDWLDANKDAALCFHAVHVLYEDGSGREGVFPPEGFLPRGVRPFYYLGDLIRRNLIQSNSVMYRWRFVNGLPDWFRADLMPGDWYWHLLHAETGKIGFINKVMSVYRRHKQGAYYLSEIDRLKHRAMTGRKELEFYDVINKHFNGKFESVLLPLTYGVFMDCRRYDAQRAKQEGREPVLDKLCAAYPGFARHFLEAQDRINAARADQTAPQPDKQTTKR